MFGLGTLSFTRPLQRFVMPLLDYRQTNLLSVLQPLDLVMEITCDAHVLEGGECEAISRSVAPFLKYREDSESEALTGS